MDLFFLFLNQSRINLFCFGFLIMTEYLGRFNLQLCNLNWGVCNNIILRQAHWRVLLVPLKAIQAST